MIADQTIIPICIYQIGIDFILYRLFLHPVNEILENGIIRKSGSIILTDEENRIWNVMDKLIHSKNLRIGYLK